jgi:signal transduction histidine kinase
MRGTPGDPTRERIPATSARDPNRTVLINAYDEVRGSWDAERLRQVIHDLLANALQLSRLAKRIIEAHGGSIEVESDEFRTVFRVSMKLQKRASPRQVWCSTWSIRRSCSS